MTKYLVSSFAFFLSILTATNAERDTDADDATVQESSKKWSIPKASHSWTYNQTHRAISISTSITISIFFPSLTPYPNWSPSPYPIQPPSIFLPQFPSSSSHPSLPHLYFHLLHILYLSLPLPLHVCQPIQDVYEQNPCVERREHSYIELFYSFPAEVGPGVTKRAHMRGAI